MLGLYFGVCKTKHTISTEAVREWDSSEADQTKKPQTTCLTPSSIWDSKFTIHTESLTWGTDY